MQIGLGRGLDVIVSSDQTKRIWLASGECRVNSPTNIGDGSSGHPVE